MKKILCMMLFAMALLGMARKPEPAKNDPVVTGPSVEIYRFGGDEPHEVGDRPLTLRMLICKHAREPMADGDGNLAVKAVEKGRQAGLDATVIGNLHVNGLEDFKSVVKSKVKTNAKRGDTLIVHTIGHGMPGGTLVTLGQRPQVSKILAEIAKENKQEIIWWQLSCYAASNLPAVDPQIKFSNIASSTADHTSPAYEQGYIMAKVFVALGKKDPAIDPNGDGVITASELRAFLNGLDNRRRGDLFFSRSTDEPIFGTGLLPGQLLRIIDRNGPQRQYKEEYVPTPGGL